MRRYEPAPQAQPDAPARRAQQHEREPLALQQPEPGRQAPLALRPREPARPVQPASAQQAPARRPRVLPELALVLLSAQA
jgi:hypothetical protein